MLSTCLIPPTGTLVTAAASQALTDKTLSVADNSFYPFKELQVKYHVSVDVTVPTTLTALTAPVPKVTTNSEDLVEHKVLLQFNNAGSNTLSHRFVRYLLKENGNVCLDYHAQLLNVTTGTEYASAPLCFVSKPGSGTHTYTFEIQAHNSGLRLQQNRCSWNIAVYRSLASTISTTSWA
jgi:hypothetical protein